MPVLREFRASRLTRGNFLFPDILRLEDDCVVRVKRGWFSTDEESIAYPRIASVRVRAGLIFASMLIESSGGTDPMEFNGLTKGAAHEAHDLLQQLQMKAMGQVPTPGKS